MSKPVSFTAEEAKLLYRFATGSDFAPSVEAVEQGAVPSQAHSAIEKLHEAAKPAIEKEYREAEMVETRNEQRSGPPPGTRSTAGPTK